MHLLYVLVLIPCGDCVPDNFTSGGSGNLIAGVDVDTGRLGPAFGRLDMRFSRLLEMFDCNPDNGRPIRGQTVPDWGGIRDALRRASITFRALPLLDWDVALSTDGVVIIEANSNSEIIGAQVSTGFGARELLSPLQP